MVETLNVGGMAKNRRLARAIADAGVSGFTTNLVYKRARYGAECVDADHRYGSSRVCSHCGGKNDCLALCDPVWWRPGCGILNDRVANAAVNMAN